MAVWKELNVKELPSFRLDAEYYQPSNIELEGQLLALKPSRLGDYAYVTDGIHASPVVVETGGVRYFSAKSVKDNRIITDNAIQISNEQDAANKKTRIQAGDVLLTTVGTIGNAAVVTDDVLPANMDRHLGLIRLHKDCKIDPFYLSTFLNCNYGRFQTLREATGNVQLNLFIEKIKELQIPKLPCMAEVVLKTKAAYAKRYESINLYKKSKDRLYGGLGLTNLNLAHELFYERSYIEASNVKRIDAEYFQPKYYRVEQAITECGNPVTKLGKVIAPIRNGFDFREFDDEGTPYIRVGDVRNGEIDEDTAKRIMLTSDDIAKDVKLKVGDVLFTRKGSFGNAAVVRNGQESAIISSEIMLVRLTSGELDPDYLAVYLNSELGYQQVERRAHGVAFYSISQPDLADLSVILAPESLQQEIKNIVVAAYTAKQEAKCLLNEATQLIEDSIRVSC